MNTKHRQNPVRFSSQTWKGHSVSQKAQILHETGPWENTLEILRKKILKQWNYIAQKYIKWIKIAIHLLQIQFNKGHRWYNDEWAKS